MQLKPIVREAVLQELGLPPLDSSGQPCWTEAAEESLSPAAPFRPTEFYSTGDLVCAQA